MIPLTPADRALQVSSTTGTGPLNLGAVTTGFQSLAAACGLTTNGDTATVMYVIDDATNFETGIGTVTKGSPDTLARDSVLSSSIGNAIVNWGVGVRNVRIAPIAKAIVAVDSSLNLVRNFGADTGTANAHVVTLSYIPQALSNGMEVTYFPNAANTSAVNTNVGGRGNKAIKIRGVDPAAGAIQPNKPLTLVYRASSDCWEAQNLATDEQCVVQALGNRSGSTTIDLGLGRTVTMTVTGNITLTFSNPLASGNNDIFDLYLTNGGAYTMTYPASVKWPGGSAPDHTASGTDHIVFSTTNGGTSWIGHVAGVDVK